MSLTVSECREILLASERGKRVGGLLRELLDGPGASLDQNGQMAVVDLLDAFWFRGTRAEVLEALREHFSTREDW